MARNFFELSESYLAKNQGNKKRVKTLIKRAIIVQFLSDDYSMDKQAINNCLKVLEKKGFPCAEKTILGLARLYRLNYLALNGDSKIMHYFKVMPSALSWTKEPFECLVHDGIRTWQDVEKKWQEEDCHGCKIKKELSECLDELAFCQESILKLRETILKLGKENFSLSKEIVYLKKRVEFLNYRLLQTEKVSGISAFNFLQQQTLSTNL